MIKGEKSPKRNPIAWAEIGILAAIIGIIATIGFMLLNSNINTIHTSLDNRITTIHTSLNNRITDLTKLGAVVPFPVPEELPMEKLKEIQKSALLTAERGEEIVMVPAGDYIVLPIQFTLGETATIEWQAVGKNLLDFYLLDEEGNVYRISRTADYSSVWMSPNDATFYLYFSNTFEPTNPKNLWIRLVESE